MKNYFKIETFLEQGPLTYLNLTFSLYSSVFQPFYGCGTQNDQNKLCGTQITLKKTLRNPNFSKVTSST
jgi:hypothetical protein